MPLVKMFDVFKRKKKQNKSRNPSTTVSDESSELPLAETFRSKEEEEDQEQAFPSTQDSENASGEITTTSDHSSNPLPLTIMDKEVEDGPILNQLPSKEEENGDYGTNNCSVGDEGQEDLQWGHEWTKKKEERIATQIKRRRGLEEEEFTESSMPVRRPVRYACQICHSDIEINDNKHRIFCDDARGRHYFCKRCTALKVEGWVNGELDFDLRRIKVGAGRGMYALQCMASDCESGCLNEVQLRPLLEDSLYNSFQQKLLQARNQQVGSSTSSTTAAAAPEQPSHASFLGIIETGNQSSSAWAEKPRQSISDEEELDPKVLVRQWKQQRRQELLEKEQQPYQELPALEQKFLKRRHQLFQHQLSSLRALGEQEMPAEALKQQRRATTLSIANSLHRQRDKRHQQQRASTQSLPTMSLEKFLKDDDGDHNNESINSESSEGVAATTANAVARTVPEPPNVDEKSRQNDTVTVTCQCCYEEFPFSDEYDTVPTTVRCYPLLPNAEPHTFCAKCVRLYVEEWVFGTSKLSLRPGKNYKGGPTLVVPCLFGECLEGGFPDKEIEKALPKKSMERFKEKITPMRVQEENDEERLLKLAIRLSLEQEEAKKRVDQLRQEQLELSFSDIPNNMISVGVPAQEDTSTSSCSFPISFSNTSNSQRRSGSSNKNEAPTDPVQESYEKSLHEVEEAMSQAKFRACPICNAKFLKDEDFCNKLKCPSCATAICYICREVVPTQGYDHFCKHKRGGCEECAGKFCPLWTDIEQDNARDQEEMRERGLDAANRIWAESLLEYKPGAHPEIRVDVDKLMQKPPPIPPDSTADTNNDT